ncbi:hypothetical protein HQN60_07540 [Deefgea piscis]|uniref:Solute-binding protein family 3/N-terminal domain-containing protein n=1 Tax=Deefgea piscis TaxID=2739061 RepID=A0A6M8SR16_9NEIS|nr:hypothetical protein [Deefgea piscis]QKJ66568.1 hypothetical protein HQN60_07540 [Deefgea piscis]
MRKILLALLLGMSYLTTSHADDCNGIKTTNYTFPINAPDFHGVAIELPGILENSKTGPFPELIAVINQFYPAGKIKFSLEPVKRVYLDINNKNADFRFPTMKIKDGAKNAAPYQYSKEMLGKVTFVLYTNKKQIVTKQQVIQASPDTSTLIEAPPADWGFPTRSVINLEQSLKKLNAGRIAGVLWAQEESDYLIKKLKLHQIHRAHFDDYPDVLFFSCNERGDFVNDAISKAIKAARESGELEKAYAKVHKPYQDWQP